MSFYEIYNEKIFDLLASTKAKSKAQVMLYSPSMWAFNCVIFALHTPTSILDPSLTSSLPTPPPPSHLTSSLPPHLLPPTSPPPSHLTSSLPPHLLPPTSPPPSHLTSSLPPHLLPPTSPPPSHLTSSLPPHLLPPTSPHLPPTSPPPSHLTSSLPPHLLPPTSPPPSRLTSSLPPHLIPPTSPPPSPSPSLFLSAKGQGTPYNGTICRRLGHVSLFPGAWMSPQGVPLPSDLTSSHLFFLLHHSHFPLPPSFLPHFLIFHSLHLTHTHTHTHTHTPIHTHTLPIRYVANSYSDIEVSVLHITLHKL